MPALSVPENPDTLVKKIFYGLLGKFGAWLKSFLRGKNVLRYSDKWIFLSKGYAETAKQIFGSKIFPSRNADKIDFIHNPIKLVNTAAPVNIEKKEKIILSVGRINPGKRINLQLDAWRKLKLRNCTYGWKFIIVGDGIDLENEISYARQIGCDDVVFTGFRDPAEFYERSSIFLMTSGSEGFGMVIVEAQMYGCVPVAFDSFSALHDIITNNENGIIVRDNDVDEYANQIYRLMSDEKLRQVMADNAVLSCRKFSVEKIVDRWEQLFRELCD